MKNKYTPPKLLPKKTEHTESKMEIFLSLILLLAFGLGIISLLVSIVMVFMRGPLKASQ